MPVNPKPLNLVPLRNRVLAWLDARPLEHAMLRQRLACQGARYAYTQLVRDACRGDAIAAAYEDDLAAMVRAAVRARRKLATAPGWAA